MRVINVKLFSLFEGIITHYYPYNSVFVLNPFAEIKDNRVKDMFNKILSCENIQLENKSAIEVSTDNNKKLFIQFYDGSIYIGLSIRVRESLSNSKELNIPFMF